MCRWRCICNVIVICNTMSSLITAMVRQFCLLPATRRIVVITILRRVMEDGSATLTVSDVASLAQFHRGLDQTTSCRVGRRV